MKRHSTYSATLTILLLFFCFTVYFLLSWVIVFRDPRALIGIGNLYPLLQPQLFPMQSLLSHYGLNSIPTILFAVVSLVAVFFYLKSFAQNISLRNTFIAAILFGSITFFSFPILSTDIFSYIMSERVSTVHHENIWHAKPAAFPNDQFAVLADWKDTTSVYGAMHYYLYLVPALIGHNNLLILLILYKLLPTIFAFASMFIFYKLLILYKIKEPELALRLVFWNPLLVLELFGSAHNDSIMIFFVLLGFYLFKRKLWLLSGIVFAFAVQVKLIPIVLVFFCLLLLLQHKKFVNILFLIAGFASVNAILFSLMQVSILEFLKRVAYNGGVFWQSLPNVILTFTPQYVIYISFAFVAFVLLYLLIRLKRHKDPIYSYILIIFVYLVFESAAYWNWYVLWVLPFIVFTNDKKLFATILKLSVTSLFAYPFLWVIYRVNIHSNYWSIAQYLFIFGPPLIVYLCALLKKDWFDNLFNKFKLHKLIADKPVNSV